MDVTLQIKGYVREYVTVSVVRMVSLEGWCVLPYGRTKERRKLHHICIELVGDL